MPAGNPRDGTDLSGTASGRRLPGGPGRLTDPGNTRLLAGCQASSGSMDRAGRKTFDGSRFRLTR